MHCTVDILDIFFVDCSREYICSIDETSLNMVREKIFLLIVKLWCTAIFLETAVKGDVCQMYVCLNLPLKIIYTIVKEKG